MRVYACARVCVRVRARARVCAFIPIVRACVYAFILLFLSCVRVCRCAGLHLFIFWACIFSLSLLAFFGLACFTLTHSLSLSLCAVVQLTGTDWY